LPKSQKHSKNPLFSLINIHILSTDSHILPINMHILAIDIHILPINSHILATDTHILPIDSHIPAADIRILTIDNHIPATDTHILPIDSHISAIDIQILPINSHIPAIDNQIPATDIHLLPIQSHILHAISNFGSVLSTFPISNYSNTYLHSPKVKKVVLIIMDGWGEGPKTPANAIYMANTPFVDSLYTKYPHSQLLTSGENVGLPDGQMGNSEVGHLNIGAGRIVYQDLVKINVAIKDGSFYKHPVILQAINYAKQNNKKLHLMGLVSDGGVHSHINHLKALCDVAKQNQFNNVFIHCFTDGRDTDPKSGLGFIKELDAHLKTSSGKIATIIGRYYAMDRDRRWERVKLAYDLLVQGQGKKFMTAEAGILSSYDEGVTDEFIKPIVIADAQNPPLGGRGAAIEPGDAVICFNFRTDRCREITQALTQKDFPEQGMQTMELHYTTMRNYDDTFKNVNVIYEKDNLEMTLGEVLEKNGKTQIRIAETEKYPHVTFFFSGGREKEFNGEKRILISSPKVATYDLQPEMSAVQVTDAIVAELQKGEADFVCLNFANPDMVGHTGVFPAIIKAVETIDTCVQRVVEAGLKSDYSFLITADHGNADYAINEDGSPNTAHTTNPVPLFLINSDYKKISNGRLCDLAPTILKMMNIDVPKEMTGNILVQ
jgi:2,3-bisphosphoglycerate-independent phosphoglycerate mutase